MKNFKDKTGFNFAISHFNIWGEIICYLMRYMIFQYSREPVLIQRIFFGFEAILKIILFIFTTKKTIVLINFYVANLNLTVKHQPQSPKHLKSMPSWIVFKLTFWVTIDECHFFGYVKDYIKYFVYLFKGLLYVYEIL